MARGAAQTQPWCCSAAAQGDAFIAEQLSCRVWLWAPVHAEGHSTLWEGARLWISGLRNCGC